jgi:hypothetical protein
MEGARVSFLLLLAGWTGNVFIVVGLWGVGNKRRGAFWCSMIGEACYIWRSYIARDPALGFVCVVFLLMALRGYVLWGRERVRWVCNVLAAKKADVVTLRLLTDATGPNEPARDVATEFLLFDRRNARTLRGELDHVLRDNHADPR